MRVPIEKADRGRRKAGLVGRPDSNSLPGFNEPRAVQGLLFTTFYLVRQGAQ